MIQPGTEHWIDAGAIGIVIGSLAGYLPGIASLLTILWMMIRIYETETVRNWVRQEQKLHEKRLVRNEERKIEAEENVIEKAKEVVKPIVVAEVVEALPLHPVIAEAVKEKLLAPKETTDDEQSKPEVASTEGR